MFAMVSMLGGRKDKGAAKPKAKVEVQSFARWVTRWLANTQRPAELSAQSASAKGI
jgi:predicted phage gp36 major capsid-like protein